MNKKFTIIFLIINIFIILSIYIYDDYYLNTSVNTNEYINEEPPKKEFSENPYIELENLEKEIDEITTNEKEYDVLKKENEILLNELNDLYNRNNILNNNLINKIINYFEKKDVENKILNLKKKCFKLQLEMDKINNNQYKKANLLKEKEKLINQINNKEILQDISLNIEEDLQNNKEILKSKYKGEGSEKGYIMPCRGEITSEYGYRMHPIFKTTKYHSGIDIAVDYGSPILASNDGVVIYSSWYTGFGKTIIMVHGEGLYTLYGHNSELLVKEGDIVYQGQPIALAGSTGYSTGPHCHFSLWVNNELINPLLYLK